MALEISYSPQFFDSLEDILNYFDGRNGSNRFSKKLLKMIHKQIKLASTMPEIGRLTDFPGVRILFVERFAIDYQIRDNVILIIDIYSCQTDPEERAFQKQWPAEITIVIWQDWKEYINQRINQRFLIEKSDFAQ